MTRSVPIRVLLIDDEIDCQPSPTASDSRSISSYMWYYAQELRDAGFQVVEMNDVDEAIAALQSDLKGFDLIILDVMMPGGKSIDSEKSARGLRTGVFLSDRIQEISPNSEIIILTNQGNGATLAQLESRPHIRRICAKIDFPPDKLVSLVQAVFGGSV